MENPFRLPFAYREGVLSERHPYLIQIIIVISSGILSSSAIATVVKAWLDNRKTTLTIEIDGDRKKLQYEGHHLNQDTPTIQTILNTLSEGTRVVTSVDAVITLLTSDEQKQEDVLEAGSHQENTIDKGAASRS